jgi:hypothetical protein
MKAQIETRIEIHASKQKVWEILMNFENYPTWNPFIRSITGLPQIGSRIEVKIQPVNSKSMIFKPIVLVNEEEKEFKWIGSLVVKGIFDGEHCFQLIDSQEGFVTFIHREKFNGLLVPFLRKMIHVTTKNSFEMMNIALKKVSEAQE